jgi:lipopolysaccharide export system protein LptA
MSATERGLSRLGALLLCLPALAHGLASDRDQPITIEANTATLKEKEEVSIYRGNVHLNQGTLKLHGDTLTVYTKDEHIEKAILTGTPATFVQRPDGEDIDQHAEAQRMDYQATDGLLILTGAARVWQTDGKELRSEKITYDINRNTALAGSSDGDNRVHIILQPKPREPQPSAPETAPATKSAPSDKSAPPAPPGAAQSAPAASGGTAP